MSAGRKIYSQSQHWGNPLKYVIAVREFFEGSIDLDPCSNQYSLVNAVTEYKLPEVDGLRASWNFRRIYVNPPYGADWERGTRIIDWFARCVMAHEEHGSEVLALVPVATNTKHWKNFVFGRAGAICFLSDTRLKFTVNGGDGGKGAPMSCAMVYWGERLEQFQHVFARFGAVLFVDRYLTHKVAFKIKEQNSKTIKKVNVRSDEISSLL